MMRRDDDYDDDDDDDGDDVEDGHDDNDHNVDNNQDDDDEPIPTTTSCNFSAYKFSVLTWNNSICSSFQIWQNCTFRWRLAPFAVTLHFLRFRKVAWLTCVAVPSQQSNFIDPTANACRYRSGRTVMGSSWGEAEG